MAFWTESSASPKRNYRWLVTLKGDIMWWAKTINTPSYEVSEIEHNFMDNKYYFPGRVSWNEITITLVDPVSPDMVKTTLDIIEASGYKVKESSVEPGGEGSKSAKTISKGAADSALDDIVIQVLDADGKTIEEWTLSNAWIKSAKYGDLDYSNDELRTVEMVVRYDWAKCEFFKTDAGGKDGTFNPAAKAEAKEDDT